MNVRLPRVTSLGKLHLWSKIIKAGNCTSGKSEFHVKRKDLSEATSRSLNHSWGCSQVEEDLEDEEAMDWFEDDEILRQRKK